MDLKKKQCWEKLNKHFGNNDNYLSQSNKCNYIYYNINLYYYINHYCLHPRLMLDRKHLNSACPHTVYIWMSITRMSERAQMWSWTEVAYYHPVRRINLSRLKPQLGFCPKPPPPSHIRGWHTPPPWRYAHDFFLPLFWDVGPSLCDLFQTLSAGFRVLPWSDPSSPLSSGPKFPQTSASATSTLSSTNVSNSANRRELLFRWYEQHLQLNYLLWVNLLGARILFFFWYFHWFFLFFLFCFINRQYNTETRGSWLNTKYLIQW